MSSSVKNFDVEELTRATNNFARPVGAGGSGEVFEGVLADETRVAVKRCTGGATHRGFEELLTEVSVLSRVDSVNVLRVLGLAFQRPGVLMLVMPYLERGSLHAALHIGAGGAVMDAAWRVGFVAGVAHGIRALHEAQIVHRDVKSPNVLVSDAHGRGLHSFPFPLNLSLVCHKKTPYTPQTPP